MNKQRQAFYARRVEALRHEAIDEEVLAMVEGQLVAFLDEIWPEKGDPEDEELDQLVSLMEHQFGVVLPVDSPPLRVDGQFPGEKEPLGHLLLETFSDLLADKRARCAEFGTQFKEVVEYPSFDWFQRDIMLRILDAQWKDHLHTMDGLRESVGLRGYAQRDPKLEYQREGFGFFAEMEQRVDEQALETIFKFEFPRPRLESTAAARASGGGRSLPGAQSGPSPSGASSGASLSGASSGDAGAKVGRNEPCPCGSGKKYKRCHGA